MVLYYQDILNFLKFQQNRLRVVCGITRKNVPACLSQYRAGSLIPVELEVGKLGGRSLGHKTSIITTIRYRGRMLSVHLYQTIHNLKFPFIPPGG